MSKKSEIITRLLEAKHITVEEAMELMMQENQHVNVWPQIVPIQPYRYTDNPYWPQRVWCGGATTNEILPTMQTKTPQ